ncbi:nickel-dependent lactate racemase [Acetomicrobium sp. S15 = DSM 107314]|uniref:nickel-dependent lactate racemase n=1 Tax=Acetomicrobium sp. S15 = DSM 107314 TaxID=2529858 RepID=UPI0018E163FB|nr:nickel-dependent lactate racemase [Acetomicrobium sp. S15 = DSM 107314]
MEIRIPYGDSHLVCDLPDERVVGVLAPAAERTVGDEKEIVLDALENPIGSPLLRELVRGKRRIVVITSDHTRSLPSHVTLPLLLEEIRRGSPGAEITILIATGGHRAPTTEEMRTKFGSQIADSEHIVVHDSHNGASLVYMGRLPSGGDFSINRLAVEAELLVAEGFIEPHFFAGFSGGRKSVLPGIAGYESVLANHCAEFIAHPKARTGILEGNPIHEDMLYAAEASRLAFILNVALDSQKKICDAFAGHWNEAHLAGCAFVRDRSCVKASFADIVITSNGGYPLDQNIYQAVKGMTAAEATCREGGVIIIAAECRDGHGGEAFYRAFERVHTPGDLMEEILLRGRDETQPDQWQIQIFARVLMHHPVIMVTSAPKDMVEALNMMWAPSLEEALAMAEGLLGDRKAKITVVPDGVATIVEP